MSIIVTILLAFIKKYKEKSPLCRVFFILVRTFFRSGLSVHNHLHFFVVCSFHFHFVSSPFPAIKTGIVCLFLLIYHYKYNITAEMRSERNQKLVSEDDRTDFIVASSLSSLFLAQLAEIPDLDIVFKELLSNEGNELYLKDPRKMGISGTCSVRELRQRMLERRAVFLGYFRCGEKHFNPPLGKEVEITDDTRLLVISEQ